jgi:hypothetical protein
MFTEDEWHFKADPHKVVPHKFRTHTYEVLGFSAPAGKEIRKLMVCIRYTNGGETTLNYLTVLRDFLNSGQG